jgi:hypothetical protein
MNINREDTSTDVIYIGKTNFRGQDKIFGLRHEDRFQHTYIIGQTGTGKSTLLKNMAVQDIEAGRGLAVVDPHGEFVDELLETIPEERMDDVLYFNPVDLEHPMGFNVLEVKDPEHKHLISSGLMSIFTKIWENVWSARMEYILNNTVLALIDTPGSTLLGIPRMLVDKIYRQTIVNNCKDPVVRSYWINEYEQYETKFRTEAIAPIQNKVGQFLSTPIIRNVVGQTKSTLDIEDAMKKKKIVLINVSKGKIGEDNSALLGAMIITKIQLTAMERVRLGADDRPDFLLYVDEFQNFATDSFASILSEARKYRLGMVISHQYIGQLVSESTRDRLRDAIFGNVGTTITFRVGARDAEFLEQHYAPEILQEDLINLPNYNVYMRLLIDGVASRPFSAKTLPPIHTTISPEQIQAIINYSRKNYTRTRKEVEDEISRWAGMRTAGLEQRPDPIQSSKSDTQKETEEEKEQIKKVVAPSGLNPAILKPKYDTDLSHLGIVLKDEEVTRYRPVEREIPEPASLSELPLSQGEDKKRKRKRKKKKKKSVDHGQLQGALNEALGIGQNMYPTVGSGDNQQDQQSQQTDDQTPQSNQSEN